MTTIATDREVAGLRCSQVLELLGEFIDGELDEPRRRAVEAHVAGCDVCERFGGRFAAMVRAVRALASDDAETLDDAALARLQARLSR